MRLHELIDEARDVVVYHEGTAHTLVLTPEGAVFNSEDTDDLTNMSIAFGMLFDDKWRRASSQEIEFMRNEEDDMMLCVVWCTREPTAPRARNSLLRAVKTSGPI